MANGFDFSNIGSIFGGGMGGTPSGLDALLSEDQRKLLGRNAAMSAAAALLQASGRSTTPINLGQALGSALQAGQQGYQQARAGSLQDILLEQKLKEAKTAQDLQKQVAGVLTKAPTVLTPEQQALAAPGMQVGPTVARAELADSIQPPSANELKAGQYQQIADIYAAQGRSEDAKRYQEMSEKLNPRAEITGQPFEVTDPKGNPILVQQYKDGTVKTMQGYGPKRDVVLQNLGGQTVAINKSGLKGGESFVQTMTPAEIANLQVSRGNLAVAQGGLNLRQKEFNRGAYDVKEGPDGFYYVPKTPDGGASIPVMGVAGQLTPGKEAPQAFSEATKKLNNLRGNISAYRTEIEADKTVFPSEVPLPFGAKIPLPTGSDTARLRGKYQSLLMGVKDLYELGALTGPDMGIISEQLTNPASFSGMFTSRNAMKEQIKVLEDMATRAEENLSSTYKRKLPAASTAGIQPPAGASAGVPTAERRMVWRNGRFEFE
jgi:hypothetical protein